MGYFNDLRDGLVECDDDEEQEMLMAGFEPDDAEDRRLWRMGYRTHLRWGTCSRKEVSDGLE